MTAFLNMGLKRPFFYGIFILLIFILLSPFFLNRLINTAYIKNDISAYIHRKTGTRISASNFSIALFPQVTLTLEDLTLTPANQFNIDIDRLTFYADVNTLLRGRLYISRMQIDHPVIQQTKIENHASVSSADAWIPGMISKIEAGMNVLPGYPGAVDIRIVGGSAPNIQQIDGSIHLSENENQIHLSTTLKGIGFNPSNLFSDSIKQALDLEQAKVDTINLFVTRNADGDINGRCQFMSPRLTSGTRQVLFDAPMVEALFKLSDNGYQIDVPPIQVNTPKGSVAVHFSNNPSRQASAIQFTGKNIHIDQARKMSDSLFKDNKIAARIFDIVNDGLSTDIDVSFKNKDLKGLFDPDHLILKGNIENGIIQIPETGLTVSGVFGSAHIHDGILDVTVQKGKVQGAGIEKGTLTLDLLHHHDFPFQGDFFLDIDLQRVPDALTHLLPGTILARELSLVHAVSGRAKTRLTLSMPSGQDLDVTVDTRDFSVNGRYDRIPGNISLENITFSYASDTVTLKNVNGLIHNQRIDDLESRFDFKTEAWVTITSGTGMIHLDSMIPWLMAHQKSRKMISPIKKAGGKLHISSMDLSGPLFLPEKWQFHAQGTAAGVDIATDMAQPQIENLSCRYQASDKQLTLENIHMKANRLTWLDPLIEQKYLESILLPLELTAAGFHISENQSYLNATLHFTSGPELSIYLAGKTPSSYTLNKIKLMDQGFSNTAVSFDASGEKPVFDFSGILDTASLKKMVLPNSHLAGKITHLTNGRPVVIYKDQNSVLNVFIESLNLDSMFSPSRIASPGKSFMPDGPINFNADKVTFKDLTITHIESRITADKNQTDIKINNAFLCDLATNGSIRLNNDHLYADIPFNAHNKANIQDLLICLKQKNGLMDGRYSLSGRIKTDAPLQDAFASVNGSLILTAEQGRIYKWTLLSRILSVLNVSKLFAGKIPDLLQEGFAYKTITIEADIKESRIHLEKAIIDGNDMTLVFTGWIDPLKGELNLTCLVAPFKTVDLIIRTIPIVNTLLEGRLISVPLQASGKISDPSVVPLHPSAVGTGLVNMLAGILKTPVKLWNKISGE